MSGISLVHLVALLVGIIVILLIRKRYHKIRPIELALIIGLYIVLVLIFTEPIVNLVKKLTT